jgi:serine/threonine protein kinase
MVDQHRHVYLVDFGLTRALDGSTDSTQPGILTGTPWYMSPEQADARTPDHRSDIYSLGMTLFELAARGAGPFTASRQDKGAVLEQVRAGAMQSLASLSPDIPVSLERIIVKALAHRPEDRYQSAEEMARALEALVDAAGSTPTTCALPAPKQTIRLPRWLLVGAACAIALAATIGLAVPYVQSLNDDGKQIGVVYPVSLRAAPPNVAMPLMKNNHEPLWTDRVHGNGGYRLFQNQLEVFSPKDEPATILALADPRRASYEFSIEVNQLESSLKEESSVNEIGLVLGWKRRPADADEHPRFLALQLNEFPRNDKTKPGIVVGTCRIVPDSDLRKRVVEPLKPLPASKAHIAFDGVKGWHLVTIRVEKERVTATVDKKKTVEFTLDWLRAQDRHAGADLSTQGAVGVWVRQGRGFVRHATLTPLND